MNRADVGSGDPFDELTGRERQVLTLVAKGYSNKQIAKDLDIRVGSVEQHLVHVYDKLHLSKKDVSPRTAAIIFAFQSGLVPLTEI